MMERRTTPSERRSRILGLGTTALAIGVFAAPGRAQTVTFSIDSHGPTIATLDSLTGAPITAGDLLQPPGGQPMLGPLATPELVRSGGLTPTGLRLLSHAGCVGVAPCVACPIEVDAHSFGHDRLLQILNPPGSVLFSVDEFSIGDPFITGVPSLANAEGALGAQDGTNDVWAELSMGVLPAPPPMAATLGHVGLFDGDGLMSASGAVYPGIGLVEPTPPSLIPCNTGDNVDSLTVSAPVHDLNGLVYFSVDGPTATANGFQPGDVLFAAPGLALPFVYASAAVLGLDQAGAGTDDLDALLLFENGTANFQPSQAPFDWIGGGSDMLLFSVRRGSALIGTIDSLQGLAIEEGDVLTTPIGGAGAPGIFIAAEALGLATFRAYGEELEVADDLDALAAPTVTFEDCDGNGVEDTVDLANGTLVDGNGDGIPDACQPSPVGNLFCPGDGSIGNCPCGNINDGSWTGVFGTPGNPGGCSNSQFIAGSMLTGFGSESVGADDLTLAVTRAVTFPFGAPSNVQFLYSSSTVAWLPFRDGILCLAGPTQRFYGPSPNAMGSLTKSQIASTIGASAGTTTFVQCMYPEDSSVSPCGTAYNLSNGLELNWTP